MNAHRCLTRALVLLFLPIADSCLSAPASNRAAPPSLAGFEGLYDSLDRFRAETANCVVLIDPTDPSSLPRNLSTPGGLWRLFCLRSRLTALSGLDCFCFHYTQLQRDTLNRPIVKAIILRAPSPAGMLKCEGPREELWAMLRETTIPAIAFCGGFHQVYMAFGGKCGDMRKLRPGEPDPNPDYAPGRLKEWGFCRIEVLKPDPLFAGFGKEIVMFEQHVSECQSLPSEFELLASSGVCRVQAIKHRSKPLYATQFHPEAYDEDHLDGKQLLLNFFRIAGVSGNLSR